MNYLIDKDDEVLMHPFFRGLAPKHWALIKGAASREVFQSGQEIFRSGFPASRFYLVSEGKVDLETPYVPGEGIIAVETLVGETLLGWSWLIPPYRWHFTARAREVTSVFSFDALRLRRIAEDNTDFGFELAKRIGGVMQDRLLATRQRMLEVCESLQ